eukprot:TRINITY_DN11212_c0_g1_i1.p1 TRINITY_DN11212_c0_g1~~TRINITY_DN11212_c0_g1_i1.p1  ORF type:complete len:547 (+),score=108.75 TRINITY_DN11212_c0_g1_i1:76-1641(+)
MRVDPEVPSPRKARGAYAGRVGGGGLPGPPFPGGEHKPLSPQPSPRAQGKRTGGGPQCAAPPRVSRRGRTPEPRPAADMLRHAGYAGGCAERVGEPPQDPGEYGTRVTRRAGEGLGLTVDERMRVTGVVAGSAAEAAGLRKGQRLRGVNGTLVRSQDEAVSALRQAGSDVWVQLEDRAPPGAQGKASCTQSPARRHGCQGEHPWALTTPLRTPDPGSSPGLPGLGPQRCWQPDAAAQASPSWRERFRNHQEPAIKPTQHSPAMPVQEWRAVRGAPGIGNKTSYQVAHHRGDLSEGGQWNPVHRSGGRAQCPHAEGNGSITSHVAAPCSPAARHTLWREHSPRRGLIGVIKHTPAKGCTPGMHAPESRVSEVFPDAGRRRPDGGCSDAGAITAWDPSPGRSGRVRSRSVGAAPLSSWSCHGDVTSWRDAAEVGHAGDPIPTGTRLRSFHQFTPDFEVPRQPLRQFTPTLRRPHPQPQPSDGLDHLPAPYGQCYSPRAGKRSDPGSPNHSHKSHGVWAIMRHE